MRATIASDENLHYPVLLNEVLSIISPQNGGTFMIVLLVKADTQKKF